MTDDGTRLAYYTRLFATNVKAGCDAIEAAIVAAEAYLDGKPHRVGKRKVTRESRDASFWFSEFLRTLPAHAWDKETLVLALTRYMSQERVSNPDLLDHVAGIAPQTVHRAIRYSGLVLRKQSPRRTEIDRLAVVAPEEFGELVRVLDAFDLAYHERVDYVETLKKPLAGLTPLELLVYASLYAFEYLVPRDLLSVREPEDPDTLTQVVWDTINDLLIWKLGSAGDSACRLTEGDIGRSLATHLVPLLFPSAEGPKPRQDLYIAFCRLLAAQIELNSFLSRSADEFSYNDSIAFVLKGDKLEIVERGRNTRAVWDRNGQKLGCLHCYWFYRAVEEFAASDLATRVIGSPENHEANRFAYIKAIRTHLQLTEVYGLAESVAVDSGLHVDLFQALLSLELMTAFFKKDFILPYMRHLGEMGNSRMALGRLAFAGLARPGSHNRFPITWSDRTSKIANITGWTVSEQFPQGSPKAAEAILDFWTSDWAALATRLRKRQVGPQPDLFDRPIVKMGDFLFQLPWVVAMQNNASAAINNLRRIGSRRAEARDETRRIEERLAKCFEQRGFQVCLNYYPERTTDDDPGEVDMICARDGQVLVLEIKSTFLRKSQKEAWIHGVTTLRKAGLQLHRKVQAVKNALITNSDFATTLGFESIGLPSPIRGWIVDTSIEHDHERFNGFLKVSLEEVLIALRDDRHLLNDPQGLLAGTWVEPDSSCAADVGTLPTLYPEGLSFSRFVEVIEDEQVWDEPGLSNQT